MHTIKLIKQELNKLQDKQIELVYNFITMLREQNINYSIIEIGLIHKFISMYLSKGNDPIFADNAVYEGNIPSDISVNHDSFLYGNDMIK